MDPLDRAIGILDTLGTWVGVAVAIIAYRLAKAKPAVLEQRWLGWNVLTLCPACHSLFDGSRRRLRRNVALAALYAGYASGCVVCDGDYSLEPDHRIPRGWHAPV